MILERGRVRRQPDDQGDPLDGVPLAATMRLW
jgi:hypothetical protein